MRQIFNGKQGHLTITAYSNLDALAVNLTGELNGNQESDEVEEITLLSKMLAAVGDRYQTLIVDIRGLSSMDADGHRALNGLLNITTESFIRRQSDLMPVIVRRPFTLEQLAA